jgi:DNA-binding MarR family transcriptional regulator
VTRSLSGNPPTESVDLGRTDDVDRLRVAVLRLARRIRTGATGSITPSQLFVLASLLRHGQLTVGQIAEVEHVKPPSASKIVSALEREGLVERTTDDHDRRCTHIRPTAAGRDLVEQVRAAGRSWISDRLPALAADDVIAIERALPAFERLLQVDE